MRGDVFLGGFIDCRRKRVFAEEKKAMRHMRVWLAIGAVFLAVNAFAQAPSEYDALVQKGKTQLQGGSAELALATGSAAIQKDPDRWEAYALTGGALMNLKHYEDAADKLSQAIPRAPEGKQGALRDLRRQCFVAESGSAPAPKEVAPAATSQAEIVLWKSIENGRNPNDFDAYLKQYPNGAFAPLAVQRSESIKIAEEEATRKQQEEAAAALKNKQDHIPVFFWDGHGWHTPQTGHLEITADGATFTGWDKTVQFAVSSVSSIKEECSHGTCSLKFALVDGQGTIEFDAVTEEDTAKKFSKREHFLPPRIIEDRIVEIWGWKPGFSGTEHLKK
jgi:hypothetical protein